MAMSLQGFQALWLQFAVWEGAGMRTEFPPRRFRTGPALFMPLTTLTSIRGGAGALTKHHQSSFFVGQSVSRGAETFFPLDMAFPFLPRLQLQSQAAGPTGFPPADFWQISCHKAEGEQFLGTGSPQISLETSLQSPKGEVCAIPSPLQISAPWLGVFIASLR